MLLEHVSMVKLLLLERALARQDVWRQVAECCGLNPTYHLKESSANGLLLALFKGCVTVESLRESLLALNLHEAVSLICEQEKVCIVRQPYCVESEDCFWEDNNLCVRAGGRLHLKIDAAGNPLPSFQWFCDNIALSSGSELIIPSFSKEMEGLYYCTVQQLQDFGWDQKIISEDVTIQIAIKVCHAAPRIKNVSPREVQELECGQDLIASVEVSAYPEPEYSWWHGNKLLEGYTSDILRIPSIDFESEGKYECRVKNAKGESCQEFMFQVKERKPLPTEKRALIIANSDYVAHKLHTPHNDAEILHMSLEQNGFQCTVCKDQSTNKLRESIEMFCAKLKQGAYALFYFGGHGCTDKNSSHLYLMGCDAHISEPKEEQVINQLYVLDKVQKQRPLLFISILDMCQTSSVSILQPKQCEVKISEDVNVIQCYATSLNRPALEKQGGLNSVYMRHFQDVLCNMKERNFVDMIQKVNERVRKETSEQVPTVVITMKRHDFRLSDPLLSRTRKK